MTKWAYFMTLFVGAAVCVWLILLNARTATESSSAAIELERSENTAAYMKEQLRQAVVAVSQAEQKIVAVVEEPTNAKAAQSPVSDSAAVVLARRTVEASPSA